MRIDFLIGDNPYGTASHFSKKLAEALEKKGVQTRLFEIGGGNFYKAYYAIQQDPPDLTCSFSDITIGEKMPLGEAWGLFHLSFFIDHAVYFLHQLSPNYSMVGAIDQEDVLFMQHLGYKRAFVFPHGVESDLKPSGEAPCFDLAFLGTCIDFEEIQASWKKKYTPRKREILEECQTRVLEERISCLRALLDCGVEDDLPLLHQELENYVRGKDRVTLLKRMPSTSLHIWGKGKWKKFLPDANLHAPVPFSRALKVIGRSKILLNSVPTLQHSSHERLFSAPLLGCLPLTSDSVFVREHFNEHSSVTTSFPHHGAFETARMYLENDEKKKAVVERARAVILQHHTWDARASTLLAQIPIFLVEARARRATVDLL